VLGKHLGGTSFVIVQRRAQELGVLRGGSAGRVGFASGWSIPKSSMIPR
jgi:hypothetical protein